MTGATGFVGAHTVSGLLDHGMAVGTVARAGSDLSRVDPRATVLRHDGSTEGMFAVVQGFKPQAAVHIASKFVAQHQPVDIDVLIDANLRFGTQLLDALARSRVTRLVNIGTSWEHFEGGDYHPANLYAATKYAFQMLCAYYVEAEGLRCVTLKLSDTYGPNDPRPKLIALLARMAKTGETAELSPGGQTINFLHVDDVAAAIRVALARTTEMAPALESFAIRGPEQMTLRAFVDLFGQVAGTPLNVAWGAKPYRAREVMTPWLGETLPGWRAKIPLETGLKRLLADV